MNNILADYAPSTQRKDKFKLDMRVTKSQAKEMESNPFFSLYLNKYGKTVMPVFLLSKVFNDFVPRLADYKLIRPSQQVELWGKKTAPTLTIEKQSDGFLLEWVLNVPSTVTVLLRSLYQVSNNDFITNKASDGTEILPLDKQVFNALHEKYGPELADTKITLDTEAINALMTKDTEKLAFSCVRQLVIDISNILLLQCTIQVFISAKEAELLTRLQYLAIRNIDIYPVVLHWLASGYSKGPTTSVSLSRVSANIDPASAQYAKTNEHNLLLTSDGEIWYIPKEINKSRDYESLFTQYCTSDNADNKKFGLMVRQPDEPKVKLPSNMPILVDWTNAKFTYSTTSGGQAILDLSRCRPLTATHVRNLFRRLPFSRDIVYTWYKYAQYLGIPYNELTFKLEDGSQSYTIVNLVDTYSVDLRQGEVLTLYELLGNEEFKPAINIISKIARALEEKSEQFMNEYSVATWVSTLGLLKAIAVYGSEWETKYSLEDKQERSASINQAVTPGWTIPSVPFWNNAPGLMPHQTRVLNMMKDDPKFCLLPVAAGGGKTPLAIMDILKQYSQGKNAPYMVLCPNMLVSQYVQEISFFTKGRLNAIPITTAVIRRNGFERLQKIFDAAPRNTVVVVSYNAIVYNSHRITYGTNTITRFPTVEFLRQFKFGYALCDESHQLKSEKSIRAKAVKTLLSDIPMIRLASGTLAYNRINDIVGQASIMDPSLFGTQADFEATFGVFIKGKFAGLKKGAEALINSQLKEDMVIAGAQRKEWAALLPQTETNYYMVNLSPQEQEIYQKVLDIASNRLEDTPELKKAMDEIEKLKEQQKVSYSQERQDLIEEREERLTSRITPYLQKLERLIIDPLKESAMITEIPPDYVSEKVRKVIQLVEHHIEGWDEMEMDSQGNPTGNFVQHLPTPGKVIIFTENIASAQSIFDGFSKVGSSVAENGLLYSTTNKHELLNKFNTDPNIKWMVGVETSINTGLNLQAASRIIRAEYPWQPGALEQGNARILRPLLKSKDGRTTVYFDWIVCDGTIDTLKVSRLMAKATEIARFEHPSDKRYQEIGFFEDPITHERTAIPVIGVTMKSIRNGLRFVNPDHTMGDLYQYYEAMKALHNIEKEDYQNYRLQHPEEINEDGTMKSVPVTVEANPKDAKMLRYIPYVEGTNLYNSEQLGLQRLDEYLNRVSKQLEEFDDDEDDSVEESIDVDQAYLDHLQELKGEIVYCEYGECQLYSISTTKPNCVVVPMHSTQRIRVPLSSVFLITKKVVKPEVMYKALAKEVGITTVVEPEYVRPSGAKETSKGLRKLRKQHQEEDNPPIQNSAELQINLKPTLINGLLGLRFTDIDGHDLGVNILEQNGFRLAPEYYRAQIKNLRMLEQWLVRMTEMGLKFRAPYDYSGSWKQIAGLMRRRQNRYGDDEMEYKANTAVITKVVSKGQLKNILRWDVKPTNRTDVLRVQPMFSNGVVFAIMPSNRLYSIGSQIRRKRIPGMKWERGPESYERYFASKQECLLCLKQLEENGLTITNLKQVVQTVQKARIAKFDDIDSIKEKVSKTKRTRRSKWDLHLDLPEDGEIEIIPDRKRRTRKTKSPWDLHLDLPDRTVRIRKDEPFNVRKPRRVRTIR